MPTHPTAFISYSWDDETHKVWVKELATRLRADGVDARLDLWHTALGDQLPEFMEREIRDSDYVIIVCTPRYKAKSETRAGGVGYEGGIMTAEVFAKQNHRKFIPILARGTWEESAPSWLSAKHYADLSDAAPYAEGYRNLLTTILGTRPKPPPLGQLPASYRVLDREAFEGKQDVVVEVVIKRSPIAREQWRSSRSHRVIRIPRQYFEAESRSWDPEDPWENGFRRLLSHKAVLDSDNEYNVRLGAIRPFGGDLGSLGQPRDMGDGCQLWVLPEETVGLR